MHRLIERWVLVASIAFGFVFGLRRVAHAADPAGAPSPTGAPAPPQPLPEPSFRNFLIIAGIIVLMATLFIILFFWQQRVERSSFLSRVYRDAVQDNEVNRLARSIREKWEQGTFLDEILYQRSPRGVTWLETHPKPSADNDLIKAAVAVDALYLVREVERALDAPGLVLVQQAGSTHNPFAGTWGTAPPGLNRRTGGNPPLAGNDKTPDGSAGPEQQPEPRTTFPLLLDALERDVKRWLEAAKGQAWAWYQEELASAEETASDQAKKALSVDFSALRGRGPEFVLEFTAVVVIIFAAVILGTLGALHSEQIGTLLAAIAGYVLGKGTSRSRADESGEQKKSLERPMPDHANGVQPGGPVIPPAPSARPPLQAA